MGVEQNVCLRLRGMRCHNLESVDLSPVVVRDPLQGQQEVTCHVLVFAAALEDFPEIRAF